MFVASYARLPPGSRFHLSVNVQIFPCNARYRAFAVTIWLGSDHLLQCAIPPRYHFITARALLQCAVPPRYRSGPLLQCAVPPRYRSGPPLQCAVPPRYRSSPLLQCAVPPRYRLGPPLQRYRLGTARALYYNARYRLGTASVPLGPSITMRGTDTPFAFYKVLNWIGVRNFQDNTKTNGKPRNATLTL